MLLRCESLETPMSQLGQNPPYSGSIVSQLPPAADIGLARLKEACLMPPLCHSAEASATALSNAALPCESTFRISIVRSRENP
jgi:hypothetical protein